MVVSNRDVVNWGCFPARDTKDSVTLCSIRIVPTVTQYPSESLIIQLFADEVRLTTSHSQRLNSGKSLSPGCCKWLWSIETVVKWDAPVCYYTKDIFRRLTHIRMGTK